MTAHNINCQTFKSVIFEGKNKLQTLEKHHVFLVKDYLFKTVTDKMRKASVSNTIKKKIRRQ